MEIVQEWTGTWPWCMNMFGARFAVFVRRVRVLPTPVYATRNLSFLRFHRRRHPVVSTCGFTGLARDGVKIPQDGNRANVHGTWRWCMGVFGARFAVFVRRARVLPTPVYATRNLSFLRVSPAPSHCCFNLLFHWNGTGRCENSTRWKSCKQVRARGRGA